MNEALLIVGMTLVTFGIRYPVLALVGKLDLPEIVKRGLRYVPVAVLTAIIAAAVLLPDGETLTLDPLSPHLWGAVAAILIAWQSKNLLATIIGGMAVFFLLRALGG